MGAVLKSWSLTFQWPLMLWLLLAVPLFVVFYIRMAARRRREAARFANLETVWGAPQGARGALRRHLPALLLLPALVALILAVARPHAALLLPSRMETVILAIDSSGSMRATDVKPDRLTAARNAAKAFVADQPPNVRVGVVAIAATAVLVQSPTRSREDIHAAIDRLRPQRGSALGSGVLIALATLVPEARIDVEQVIGGGKPRPWYYDRWREGGEPKPVPPGSHGTGAIVLISDGQSNVGPDLEKVAQMAADRGVRVYTVGVGTAEGATVSAEGWSMRVRLDETALRKVADITRGEYFQAASAAELSRIYGTLSAKLAFEKRRATEVTAIFAAVGAALAMLAAGLSMLWFNRIL
jgi:Ca-activated chloride channel family protein